MRFTSCGCRHGEKQVQTLLATFLLSVRSDRIFISSMLFTCICSRPLIMYHVFHVVFYTHFFTYWLFFILNFFWVSTISTGSICDWMSYNYCQILTLPIHNIKNPYIKVYSVRYKKGAQWCGIQKYSKWKVFFCCKDIPNHDAKVFALFRLCS